MVSNRGGDQSDRRMVEQSVFLDDTTPEHPGLNWVKLITLILLTFGLIVAVWFIRYVLYYLVKRFNT